NRGDDRIPLDWDTRLRISIGAARGIAHIHMENCGNSSMATGGTEVFHLVQWVQSVVREEWTAEVFDLEPMRYSNIEEEMIEMLQIAMACIARMLHPRPKMAGVLKMVENVQQFDNGNRLSTGSPILTPDAVELKSSEEP
ncbi:hypothetical protein GIB67_033849, partial [Kingdonia uniflora]